ncbi:TadE/TadG family type IV pilus assembly protein [Muricoccus radiodurans]|uniref:TadE/TadG family type IV pilus assembly protein n=1 Tax=Muricoccus radiodurans TaxID=2231721 RepID=UPI003CEEBC0C
MVRLLCDRRGTSAVEHALILPTFFLLLLVLLETGWQFAVAVGVDHGARRGARWVSIGADAPEGLTRAQQFAQLVVTSSGLPLDPSRLSVTPTAFSSYAALATAGTPGLGGPDEVVRYVVTYQSRPLTPLTASLLPNGWLNYRSVVIAQNEPYPAN